MATTRNMPDQGPASGNRIAVALLSLLVVANVVQAARIFDLFWEDASRFSYVAQAIVIAIYTATALWRRHWFAFFSVLVIAALLIGSHSVFTELSGKAANYNSVVTFVPMLTFIAFVEARYPIDKILRIMLVASGIYVVAYIILSPIILQNYASSAAVVLKGHGDDLNRLYFSPAYACFLMLYGLRATKQPIALRGLLILLAAVALWMGNTRSIIAITAVVFALSAFNLLILPVRVAILGFVGFAMMLILIGFVFPEWNPYLAAMSDGSGAYRAIEYNWVIRVLGHNWITGIGTPGEFVDLQIYLQRDYGVPRNIWIYASDLGILGVYFQFGLIGVVGFLAAVAFCIIARWQSSGYEMQALQLTALTCAVASINAPLLFMDPSAIFLMLLVAAWWRNRRPLKGEARPTFTEPTRAAAAGS